MFIEYRSSAGTVNLNGKDGIRTTEIQGLAPAEMEYTTVVYGGYNGQKTLGATALPRCITLSAELSGTSITTRAEEIFRILSSPGYLYTGNEAAEKRIFCSQVKIPDPTRVLRGRIAAFQVQFVCDSPYFQDAEESVYYLYRRINNLSSPFTLPCVFGTTESQIGVNNHGDISAEPTVRIMCPGETEEVQSIRISNLTTGKEIILNCTAWEGEEIVIDVPNRKITGSIRGNMLGFIDPDSFLGDFVIVPGENNILVAVGDYTSGFGVECAFYGLYSGAVIL